MCVPSEVGCLAFSPHPGTAYIKMGSKHPGAPLLLSSPAEHRSPQATGITSAEQLSVPPPAEFWNAPWAVEDHLHLRPLFRLRAL